MTTGTRALLLLLLAFYSLRKEIIDGKELSNTHKYSANENIGSTSFLNNFKDVKTKNEGSTIRLTTESDFFEEGIVAEENSILKFPNFPQRKVGEDSDFERMFDSAMKFIKESFTMKELQEIFSTNANTAYDTKRQSAFPFVFDFFKDRPGNEDFQQFSWVQNFVEKFRSFTPDIFNFSQSQYSADRHSNFEYTNEFDSSLQKAFEMVKGGMPMSKVAEIFKSMTGLNAPKDVVEEFLAFTREVVESAGASVGLSNQDSIIKSPEFFGAIFSKFQYIFGITTTTTTSSPSTTLSSATSPSTSSSSPAPSPVQCPNFIFQNVCVDNCTASQFTDSEGKQCFTSSSQCPSGQATDNQCDTCGTISQFFNPSNKQCVSACPQFSDQFTCVNNCTSTQFTDNEVKACVASDGDCVSTSADLSTNICYSCKSAQNMYFDPSTRSCVATCPTVSYQNHCLTSCSASQFVDTEGNECFDTIAECPSRSATGSQCDTCGSSNQFYTPFTKTCIASCPQYNFGSVCQMTCTSTQFTDTEGMECFATSSECPSGTATGNTCNTCAAASQFYDPASKACMAQCPQFSSGTTCVASCAANEFIDNEVMVCAPSAAQCTSGSADLSRNTCYTCKEALNQFFDDASQSCTARCPNFGYQNSCVASCTPTQFIDSEGFECYDNASNCPAGQATGTSCNTCASAFATFDTDLRQCRCNQGVFRGTECTCYQGTFNTVSQTCSCSTNASYNPTTNTCLCDPTFVISGINCVAP